MNKQEEAVYLLIQAYPLITQKEIADKMYELGPIFSGKHWSSPANKDKTRMVRAIIEKLRKNYGKVILSGVGAGGYWETENQEDIEDYLSRKAGETKAALKSMWETYEAIKKNSGVVNTFFENRTVYVEN